jgi:hypothetical protein
VNRSRRKTAWISVGVAACTVVAALLAAGCGGSSAAPGVASLGGSTTTQGGSQNGNGSASASSSKATSARAFSSCMRSHGVPNFPDPGNGGGIEINASSGINPDSPQFRAAERACRKYAPAGKEETPAQRAKVQEQLLKFSACMRSHGVPNFPDPQFSGDGGKLTIGPGSGINPKSPQFRQAQSACRQYLPGGGKGMRTSDKGGGPVGAQPGRP